MRALGRLLLRLGLVLTLVILALASPVVYVETMCRGDATPAPATPLSGETRPEVRTLLTYPEWHIVHAYDDYAAVIAEGDPHDFAFLPAISGYWRSLCTLMEESAALGPIDTATRQLVHVIGVSFTAEMLMKMGYEETIGRAMTLVRGPELAPLDRLSATQAARYAVFLRQVPWYRYDFRADAEALRAARTPDLRDRERALALGLEHGARAAYAGLIGQAVAATGGDDETLQMVVADLPAARIESVEDVRVIGPVAGAEGALEVETPRYRALTRILDGWAAEGARFVDIAGNDRILFTAISGDPVQDGALLSLPRQGHGDTRHLFLVPVADLAPTLRGLSARGLTLEHVHDY